MWVDRKGSTALLDSVMIASGLEQSFSISPNGSSLAFVILGERGPQVAVKELPNGPVSPITFEGWSARPVWMANGWDVTFLGERNGKLVALRKRADGTGEETVLAEDPRPIFEVAVSPDSDWVVYRTDYTYPGRGDILARGLGKDTTLRELLATPAEESAPAVSPGSRWLAYASDETGRMEIYVRPFPNVAAGRWQVSREGGIEPVWSPNGRELYFRARNNHLMAADIVTSPSFRVTGLRPLFDAGGFQFGLSHANYAVAPDGRFVFAQGGGTNTPGRLVLIRNLFTELRPLLDRK
jgi:serine/threonine-protein kinase